jgi:hypothetical protein
MPISRFASSGEIASVSCCQHCHFNEQIFLCAVVHTAKAKRLYVRNRTEAAWLPV